MPIPFGQGMNGLASFYAGQGAENEAQRAQADLASIAQQQQRESQMLPLDVATKQATLPGIVGVSQQQQAAGALAQGGLQAKLAENIASSRANMNEAELKQMGASGDKFLKAATAVANSGIPAMLQPGAMKKILAQYGTNEDDNQLLQMLDQVPPDQYVSVASKIGTELAKASTPFVQNVAQQEQAQKFKKEELTQTLASHEKIAGGNNATAIEVANINNQGRVSAAKLRAEASSSKPMSTDQRIAYLLSIPADERTLDDNEALAKLSQQRLAERAAGANGVPAAVLGMPAPQVAAQAASPFVNQPQAQPTPPAPPGMRQVGTSGGRPVYEDAQGRRFIQ